VSIEKGLRKSRIGVVIASFLLIVGLAPSLSSFANSMPTTGGSEAGSGAFTSEVEVPPWCGWSQTPATSDLTLDGSGLYTGTAYDLTGSSGTVYAYVNGGDTITTEASADNCSWFGTAPYSAALSMSIDSVGFSGESDANPGVTDEEFSWDGYLDLTNNFDAGSCTNYTTNPGASLDAAGSVDVWSVISDDTNTNNFCSYTITYGSQIPEGLNPTYGDSTYTITGPTLTVTLNTTAGP
jgi:hypothetical protein